MNFRYFILSDPSLETYLASEKKELDQRHNAADVLLKQRDDIVSFRPSHKGGIASIVFKEGKQPQGMVRACKDLPKNEVLPHAKLKVAEPWRELLKSIKVTEDCQQTLIKLLGLPQMVMGIHPGRSGMAMYSSRCGHVGTFVIVEVPVSDKDTFSGHADLKEIAEWEYVKMQSELSDPKNLYCANQYVLKIRG